MSTFDDFVLTLSRLSNETIITLLSEIRIELIYILGLTFLGENSWCKYGY